LPLYMQIDRHHRFFVSWFICHLSSFSSTVVYALQLLCFHAL
jgi:hypothetical protein